MSNTMICIVMLACDYLKTGGLTTVMHHCTGLDTHCVTIKCNNCSSKTNTANNIKNHMVQDIFFCAAT